MKKAADALSTENMSDNEKNDISDDTCDTCDVSPSKDTGDVCDTPAIKEPELDVHDSPGKIFKKIKTNHTTYYPDPVEKLHHYPEQHSEFVYNMSKIKGNAVIFNMTTFERSTGLDPREGSDKDAKEIKDVFIKLGFIVDRYDDISKLEMMEVVESVASNAKNLSCFVCFILSHGEDGIVFARDGRVKIKKLTGVFEGSDWNGKPKLFFIQACQGDEYMDGVDCVDAPGRQSKTISLPSQSDFLYAYSTVSGFYSWRNTSNGSWFIQTLCQILRQHAHEMTLLRMLTRVNYYISGRKSNTRESETNNKRQIASIVSQLRKDLYFFPPNGPIDI